MTALVCDLCGGKLVMQTGALAKCEYCGVEYSKEFLQEKILQISGTVKVEGAVETVKGEAEKERLLNNGYHFVSNHDLGKAKKVIDILSFEFPGDKQLIELTTKYNAQVVCDKINRLRELLCNPGVIVDLSVLRFEINELYKHNPSNEDIDTIGSIIKQYSNNINYSLDKLERNYKGIIAYSSLPFEFRKWLTYKTELLSERYDSLKEVQKRITEIYLDSAKKGIVGIDINADDSKKMVSLFGTNISDRSSNLSDLIDNKYLLNFFTEGIENAENIFQNYTDHKGVRSVFYFGSYEITWDDYNGFTENFRIDYEKSIQNCKNNRRENKRCQHCGGEFEGLFKKVCSQCGKPKDY